MPKLVLFFSGSDMSGEYDLIETNASAEDILRFVLEMQIEILNENGCNKAIDSFQKKFGYKIIMSDADALGYPLYLLAERKNILKVDTDYISDSVNYILEQ